MKWGAPILPQLALCDREQVEARVFGPFKNADPDQCWEGAHAHYGTIKLAGKPFRTHRVAWVLANGRDIPERQFVCHRCDNPRCRNPNHLFVARPAENTLDMVRKGRHGSAKLTPEIVRQIRRSPLSQRACAQLVGVARATIKDLRNRRTWGHLQ